ncbi:MAG: class I SAM-dependent methyltransferase [Nanoarchaeota archaeon]|nr:class I SAM-dependent methyltransferase [Nanoarchaeota archaeon]
MKTNIKKFYRISEDLERYLVSDKKRVNSLKKVYVSNKKFFGKRVLDIACGGGVLGFIIEPKGHSYTGIDINPDMIKNAKKYSKEVKSKNKFILGDATKKKITGKFDTITLLGNSLGHLTTSDFVKLLKNIEKNIHKGTYFIIDYRDVVTLLFEKKWKDKMIERKRNEKVISITKAFDTKRGEIIKEAFNETLKKKVTFAHAVWAPFILEPIMSLSGWKLVKRKPASYWQGWLDVYRLVSFPKR